MFDKARRAALAVAMLLTALIVPVVPMHAAHAADGCGSGWYKASDGYFTKDGGWDPVGYYHSSHIWHTGKVRFCTENDTWNDDENRRARIGYPASTYPLESYVQKFGKYSAYCVRQFIEVRMTGIKTQDSWTIGGSVSKDSASVSFSYSATYDRVTVKIRGARACGKDARALAPSTSGIWVTADNESGKVQWVKLTTKIHAVYWLNGVKYSKDHYMHEYDYS